MTRCAVLRNHQCDTGFAVGVYGGIGLFFLLVFMRCISFALYHENDPQGAVTFLLLGSLFGFSWMIGVALTGGVYAIGWVFLLWGVPIFFFVTHMITSSERFKKVLAFSKSNSWNQWKPGQIVPKTNSNSTSI